MFGVAPPISPESRRSAKADGSLGAMNLAMRSIFDLGLTSLVSTVRERWTGPKRKAGGAGKGYVIDWSQIVRDLERTGMTLGEIGVQCGQEEQNARSWAHRVKNLPGTQPRVHHGALLLGLWMVKTGKQAAVAPKEL